MATRTAARYICRRLSSSGKVLSEEEKAAENVYIKKMEQERLAKAARQGPRSGEEPNTTSSGSSSASEAKPSSGDASSASSNVWTDKNRNYAVLAGGVVTALGALGWYYKVGKKKPEEEKD